MPSGTQVARQQTRSREPLGGLGSRLDMRLRSALPLAVIVLLVSASPARAKGEVQPRGYAVLTGPGLHHPIVISAPWDPAKGGYYGTEAEYFVGFAESTGAIPAGKVHLGEGQYEYEGVLPITGDIHREALGPRYQLTWFRDGLRLVVKQDFYPNVGGGLPFVFTHHSSRKALMTIFGRFQYRPEVWTGWGKATDGDLLLGLQSKGLPKAPPVSQATGGAASQQPAPAVEPAEPARDGASKNAMALGVLVLLTAGALVLVRRRPAVA